MAAELPVVPFRRPRGIDPSPELFELHDRGRVIEVGVGEDGLTGYLVTGYDDVRTLLVDSRLRAPGSVGERAIPYGVPPVFTQAGLLSMDGPEHARLRRIIGPTFTAKRVERLRPRVQAVVDRLLDGVVAAGKPADLHTLLALPLPMEVSCELLGVPMDDRGKFVEWSGDLLMSPDGDPAKPAAAWQNIASYLGEMLGRRKAEPADDFLTDLAGKLDGEDGLTLHEATMLAAGTLVAGYETTTVEIEYSVVVLLRHPEQYKALREDPGLAAGAAEEVFRLYPPGVGTSGHQRWAATDIQLGDVTIPKDSFVLLCFASAALDPERFGPDPERFDITRRSNPHMVFGFGPHHCVGATLARLELETLLATLPRRFPDLALAVPEERLRIRSHVMTGGYLELPVTW
ncbi:cytochrome P450 [Qaidamihabitans albus]|uniref:cytochrome P450 n=1 Tax=Qaidamihabitans albus TaxID=2795733 RepID=UPI0018F24051|nr:cytochrome P450 [Qaidamihabitans albus]